MLKKTYGLYLSNLDPTKSTGYLSKILGQVNGFIKNGFIIDVIRFGDRTSLYLDKYRAETEKNTCPLKSVSSNILVRRFSLLLAAWQYLQDTQPDFVYLRYPRADPLYLWFLIKVRKKFPGIKLLSEFPTYPYDKEYESSVLWKDKLTFFLDKLTRNCLKCAIDRIVAVNYESPIFGIPTISIDNGVDVGEYRIIERELVDSESLKLIGVANVSEWHGYDRLIHGIARYYNDYGPNASRVCFHIIGIRQPYLNKLTKLATQVGIAECIVFHSPHQGESLDRLLCGAHIAIGVLGAHRKSLNVLSPLKNREYCARGIPFVFSHIDPDFSEDFKYALRVESGDGPVDVQKIVKFILNLQSEEMPSTAMREYAYENLDWSIKLKPVLAYLNETIKETLPLNL